MTRASIIKSIIFAAVALAAGGAWAATETLGGYTWTYRINGDTAEIAGGNSAAISPKPTGAVTVPVAKPAGSAAFFKVVVSDRAR